jgi:hypothetical protein
MPAFGARIVTPGAAPFTGVSFAVGRDRLGTEAHIPEAYWPLCVLEDGNSEHGKKDGLVTVCLYVGVPAFDEASALLGSDEKPGRLDLVDALVEALWEDERLIDARGVPQAPGGISGNISVEVGDVHDDDGTVLRQTAIISVTYKKLKWR